MEMSGLSISRGGSTKTTAASNHQAPSTFPDFTPRTRLPSTLCCPGGNMRLLSGALLFFLLAFYPPLCLFPSVDCSRLCPHPCICYEHADLVDCRERGFRHVPRGLPHATWLLELGGNNLSQIGTGAFAGLWSLRVLVLTNSQIQELQPQAFFPLSFLEKLDLSWNQLTSLPVDFSASLSALRELRLEHNKLHHISGYSLEYLDNMEKLDLSYNQLVTVGSGVFRGLSRLRHLYLHNNRLTTVQRGSLSMLPGLEVLQLSNNNISYIENDALAPLYSLAVLDLEGNNLHHLKFKTLISLHTTATHIQLSGNPWSCDCDLHRVFSKILHVRHLHIDDYSNVTCQDPPQLAGASLAWVDSQLCIAETATVLVITFTVLVTVVAAMVMAERNRKRNGGKDWDTDSQNQT
ncbi:insulin-like growth factor-binding protein complex acid labile subunit isoform X1 [Etheostoma cragini]|uniref:insulin-like growth factor-binding protein complex acid labile subunit isoform X1 n=2 Tax=Etheostoma cragini TaxID=417921 RepID=UPI00155E6548|nr:insulin-like growth factor-binding protein complex acid labile subunit isoform X1 [Etheostoma cragini]